MSSCFPFLKSDFSKSVCERTDTYSPAAIYKATTTRPMTPAIITGSLVPRTVATPIIIHVVDRIPSFAAEIAALNQPIGGYKVFLLYSLSNLFSNVICIIALVLKLLPFL